MDSVQKDSSHLRKSSFLRFFVPSFMGLFLFLFPVWVDGNMNHSTWAHFQCHRSMDSSFFQCNSHDLRRNLCNFFMDLHYLET